MAITAVSGAVSWSDLIVTGADGETWGKLGEVVETAPANLDNAEFANYGAITSWDGYLLSVEGEEPDLDTPRCVVDWNGLREKLAEAA